MTMKFNSSGLLRNKLYLEVGAVRNVVKKSNAKFPSMMIGAEYQKIMKIGRSGRKGIVLHPLLISELKKAAKHLVGQTVTPPTLINNKSGYVYFFGTCAEDDASNELIRQYESRYIKFTHLRNIVFTKAIRPRTMGKKSCCVVCKKVFS